MVGNIVFSGRLGNRMLQLAGAAVVARHLNLYMSDRWINFHNPGVDMDDFLKHFELNSELFCIGAAFKEPVIQITNNDFTLNHDINSYVPGYYEFHEVFFQDKQFVNAHIRTIQQVFRCKIPVEKKTDQVLVHCRIGDVRPPMTATPEFYDQALQQLHFAGGTIVTEAVNEPFIQQLAVKYGLNIQSLSPAETLAYSHGFDNLVLDQGTFSWWLGVFSQSNQVLRYVSPESHSFCPEFSLDHWKLITYSETINNAA